MLKDTTVNRNQRHRLWGAVLFGVTQPPLWASGSLATRGICERVEAAKSYVCQRTLKERRNLVQKGMHINSCTNKASSKSRIVRIVAYPVIASCDFVTQTPKAAAGPPFLFQSELLSEVRARTAIIMILSIFSVTFLCFLCHRHIVRSMHIRHLIGSLIISKRPTPRIGILS